MREICYIENYENLPAKNNKKYFEKGAKKEQESKDFIQPT